MPEVQFPSVVLPTVAPLGTEVEAVNDDLEHTSLEFPTEFMQEKEIHITAVEAIAFGVPGNLWCWIELSPVISTTSAVYWAAIGGGGGALVPLAPHIEVATGVNLAVHSIILPWAIYSPVARLVVQTPVPAVPMTAFWQIQSIFVAKAS